MGYPLCAGVSDGVREEVMAEQDPDRLADQLEGEAAQMQEQSEKVHGDVLEARQDWERKRADPKVPGAPPREGEEPPAEEQHSPAPQAPPEESEPSAAEMPPEGAVGQPAEQVGDDE